MVITSRVVRSQSTRGARKSGSSAGVLDEFGRRRRFEPEIHLHAHRAGERLDDLAEPQAAELGRQALGEAGGEGHVAKGRAQNRRSVPGRRTFTATGRRPSSRFTAARCTWAIEAAATGSPKLSNSESIFVPNEASTMATAASRGNRRHAVLQPLKLDGDLAADDIGPRRQELSELDVGRAQAGRSPARDARQAVAVAFRDRALASASGIRSTGGQRRRGRRPANAPSRAKTNEARARPETWPMTNKHPAQSELPAGVDRDDSARQAR